MSKSTDDYQTGLEVKRKGDHINLVNDSQVSSHSLDTRFFYEPLIHGHHHFTVSPFKILGKSLLFPLWISSMTGGAENSTSLNKMFAKVCKKYSLGMGLGSCRQLLTSDDCLEDFAVRKYCGDDVPLFANLGVAQIEQLLSAGKVSLIKDLVNKLEVDGIFMHINPLQEYLQPEGDRFSVSPLETLKNLLDKLDFPIGVKEVGQGMGPQGLKELSKLPLACLELSGFGGTNFSKIEQFRSNCPVEYDVKKSFINVGHTCQDMIEFLNDIDSLDYPVIISGGVNSAIDAHHLISQSNHASIYGIAFRALKHALNGESALEKFIECEMEAFCVAKSLLSPR
jgi:isopentenyl-diphosphate Delta-isomerase